jgi:hypothetical protein
VSVVGRTSQVHTPALQGTSKVNSVVEKAVAMGIVVKEGISRQAVVGAVAEGAKISVDSKG